MNAGVSGAGGEYTTELSLPVDPTALHPEYIGPVAAAEILPTPSINAPIVERSETPRPPAVSLTLEEKLVAANQLLTADRSDVRAYLQAIGSIPLLDATEEVTLAKRIERGLYAGQCLQTAHPVGIPYNQDTFRDLRFIQQEGRAAKDLFILANLRLVAAMAKRYRYLTHMKLLDIIQEGNLGLIKAVEKFDYTKGFKFSTYAPWWIREAIVNGIASGERTIRVPLDFAKLMKKAEDTETALQGQLGRPPTVAELSEKSGISAKDLALIQRTKKLPLSLDAPEGDTDTTLSERLDSQEAVDAAEELVWQEDRATLLVLLDQLPDRDILILTLLYGLDGGPALSTKEVGEKMGVSHEQIRYLRKAALQRARALASSEDFSYFSAPAG